MATFDESDCCGNGCVNCVLNAKPLQQEQMPQDSGMNIINNYTNFILKSKTHFGDLNDVVELHFESYLGKEGNSTFNLLVPSGKHIMMRAPLTEGNGKRLLRPYSPFWVDKYTLELKILVNLCPNGLMSKYISSLKTDDEVEFRGPIGGLYAHSTADNHQVLVLISQGVAIAPTLPIVKEILNNEDDMTRIFQFACFSDLKHSYFRRELHEFNKYWNYTSNVYLSRQICDNIECVNNKSCVSNCQHLAKKLFYKEKVLAKRLTIKEIELTLGGSNFNIATYVVSGSRTFQDQISNDLRKIGSNINDKKLFLL